MSCEHPDAVKELAREFARAGADVTQTFTFNSTNDRLPKTCKYTVHKTKEKTFRSFVHNIVVNSARK